MRIGDWLLEHFSDGNPIANGPDALRALLVEAGGNVSQLARDLGRPRRTVRDWLAGVVPRGGSQFLVAAARRALLDPAREDELRSGFETVTIGGTLAVSPPDSESRTLEFSFTPGFGDQLVNAYLAGASAGELETMFVAQIDDDWYRDHVGDPDAWDTDWIEP